MYLNLLMCLTKVISFWTVRTGVVQCATAKLWPQHPGLRISIKESNVSNVLT